jgi:hypothetical protein
MTFEAIEFQSEGDIHRVSSWIDRLMALMTAPIALCLSMITAGAPAHADAVAYLVNVTVRPGYYFANADAALAYGQEVCGKVEKGRAYSQIVDDIWADFNAADEFQASYLINQAVNELCPALIWQLRNSAAHYRPTGTP